MENTAKEVFAVVVSDSDGNIEINIYDDYDTAEEVAWDIYQQELQDRGMEETDTFYSHRGSGLYSIFDWAVEVMTCTYHHK